MQWHESQMLKAARLRQHRDPPERAAHREYGEQCQEWHFCTRKAGHDAECLRFNEVAHKTPSEFAALEYDVQ